MPDPHTYAVKITAPISSQIIADVIVTAFEGGIHYWCARAERVRGEAIERPWYSCPKFYEQDFEIKLFDAEEPGTSWALTPANLKRGLSLLDAETVLRIKDENYDADDADVLLQLCLFGEVCFG